MLSMINPDGSFHLLIFFIEYVDSFLQFKVFSPPQFSYYNLKITSSFAKFWLRLPKCNNFDMVGLDLFKTVLSMGKHSTD